MPIIHCSRCDKTWVVARNQRRCGRCRRRAPEISVQAALARLEIHGWKGGERRPLPEPDSNDSPA